MYLSVYFCRHNITVVGYIKPEFLRESLYTVTVFLRIFSYAFCCDGAEAKTNCFLGLRHFPAARLRGRGGGLEDEQGLLSAGNWITLVDRKGCRAALNVNCENKKVRQTRRGPLFIFLAVFSFYAV